MSVDATDLGFTLAKENTKLRFAKRRPQRPPRRNDRPNINHFIRSENVHCIDSEDVNHGVIPISEALRLAEKSGLDLVQISMPKDGVPVCKILEYSKYKYEQDKKDKAAKKKQRENAVKVKEIKLRPSTGDNDLKIKAKHAQELVDDGNRLKIVIVFKGRELSHKEVGHSTLNTFFDMLDGVEMMDTPSMTGRQMCVLIGKATQQPEKQSA